MDHKFVKYTQTPMTIIALDVVGNPILIEDISLPEVVIIGCEVCDMGIKEAMAQGPCPGQSLEDMMEQGLEELLEES